jgi:hypothetical protein
MYDVNWSQHAIGSSDTLFVYGLGVPALRSYRNKHSSPRPHFATSKVRSYVT